MIKITIIIGLECNTDTDIGGVFNGRGRRSGESTGR
jgi:hypothetical protein